MFCPVITKIVDNDMFSIVQRCWVDDSLLLEKITPPYKYSCNDCEISYGIINSLLSPHLQKCARQTSFCTWFFLKAWYKCRLLFYNCKSNIVFLQDFMCLPTRLAILFFTDFHICTAEMQNFRDYVSSLNMIDDTGPL